MVLIILAVVWALYLLSWLRSHATHRRQSSNSIASFTEHLSVLQRTSPYAPAADEPTPVAAPAPGAASTVTALARARDRRVERTPLMPVPDSGPVGSAPARPATHRPLAPAASFASRPPRTRTEVQRRRREVLFFLGGLNLVALAAALALGGLGIALLGITAALAGGYLFLLAQVTAQAAEQSRKVHYLHPADDEWYEDDDVDVDDYGFDERLLARSGT